MPRPDRVSGESTGLERSRGGRPRRLPCLPWAEPKGARRGWRRGGRRHTGADGRPQPRTPPARLPAVAGRATPRPRLARLWRCPASP